MIKYNLKCQNNHEFESWFSNSEEYEKLNKKNLLDCIYCSSKKIDKSTTENESSKTTSTNNSKEKSSTKTDFDDLANQLA